MLGALVTEGHMHGLQPDRNSSHFAGSNGVPPRVRTKRRIGDLVARLPKARAALAYAERQHAGQTRGSDGAPFILHPIEVATFLYYAGAPDHMIAAGLLHDVIEKTRAEATELHKRFGPRVATLVVAVSEDQAIAKYPARKAALREQVAGAGDEALMLFAADKLSKARELRLIRRQASQTDTEDRLRRSRQRKLAHYQRSAELLEARLHDSPLVKQLRLEIDQLLDGDAGDITLAGAA